jgi:hypothetical protein
MISWYLIGACTGIGRLLALKNAIDIACRAAKLVDRIVRISDESAIGDIGAAAVHRWQPMLGR